MAASSAANAVPSICTWATSPVITGSWKLPSSSRFDNRHHPDPSNYSALASRRRRFKNR